MKKEEKDNNKEEKLNRSRRKLLGKHITESKKVFALYAILRLLVVAVMIAQFFNGNYENVLLG